LLLYAIASLRNTRPYSLRYAIEQKRIEAWLKSITALLPNNDKLALQMVRTQQLVKGYGDTHSRGWRNFERLMTALPLFQDEPDAATKLQELQKIALSDDTEQALLTSLRAQGLLHTT
jgi:indolepyruvate ferredoxin oxidoreductase beta subunit